MTENLTSAVEAILFAAGDSVPLARLSLILQMDEQTVSETVDALISRYEDEGRGMRILRRIRQPDLHLHGLSRLNLLSVYPHDCDVEEAREH